MVPGSCLPRSVLYTHYQDFCKKNQVEASSAASFGKVKFSCTHNIIYACMLYYVSPSCNRAIHILSLLLVNNRDIFVCGGADHSPQVS